MKKLVVVFLVVAGLLLPVVASNTGNNVTAKAASFTMGEVNANNVRVRRGPGTNYDALGQVHKGERFHVVGYEGDWKKIEFNRNGVKYAYIYGSYLTDHTVYR